MPFATIAPISVGKDKDMARACDAIRPDASVSATQRYVCNWGLRGNHADTVNV